VIVGRPRKPIEELEHGTVARYRRGCKCELCRAANRDRVRDHRWSASARTKEQANVEQLAVRIDPEAPVPTIDMHAEPGPIEQAIVEDLDALVGSPPWKRTASAILRLDARVLDQAAGVDRLDLLSPMQIRAQEWMKLLRSVSGGPDLSVADQAAQLLKDLAGGDGGSE